MSKELKGKNLQRVTLLKTIPKINGSANTKNFTNTIDLVNQPYVNISTGRLEKTLIELQVKGFHKLRKEIDQKFFDRLSMVSQVIVKEKIITPTAAHLEGEKVTKSWNVNYLSHGWHRYVGRFPPHIVRSFLNIFRIMPEDTILDPFAGSGTSLVEAKLLGINSVGVEINPLSHLISRTKVKLDFDYNEIIKYWNQILKDCQFYKQNHKNQPKIITSKGFSAIPEFPNKEKWFNTDVLDQLTLLLNAIDNVPKLTRDFFYLAISAGMRSMANVDVDVVRTEYRKIPRTNVDVFKIVEQKINRYVSDMKKVQSLDIPKSKSLVISGDIKKQNFSKESFDFIITSPPYGIESISYLRTHMLSYRVLQNVLGVSLDKIKHKMIGTDYILECNLENNKMVSRTARLFFENLQHNTKAEQNRILQTIQYFQDMEKAFEKISNALKKKGYCVIVIGNKKLLNYNIPTDKIFSEIANYYGLKTSKIIPAKLVCNNITAKTPWSDRMIKDENLMIFKN